MGEGLKRAAAAARATHQLNAVAVGWAAWHPENGFDQHAYEGPIVFADLDARLSENIRCLNEDEGTNNRNGWRAVKVRVVRES